MILSRPLRISLLISFFWHLLWMASISIEFLPDRFESMPVAAIYFRGSILQPPSLAQEGLGQHRGKLKELPVSAYPYTQAIFDKRTSLSLPAEKEVFNPDELVDLDNPRRGRSAFVGTLPAQTLSLQREVIYQPPLSEYPEWREQRIRSDSAIFKIFITAEGLVEEVVNLQSTSDPEIDATLARYLRRWRFAPVAGRKGQWQTVQVSLDNGKD